MNMQVHSFLFLHETHEKEAQHSFGAMFLDNLINVLSVLTLLYAMFWCPSAPEGKYLAL